MDDEVLEAEVVFRRAVEDAKNELTFSRELAEKNQLNRALGASVAVVIVALLLSHIITTPLENDINENNSEGYPPIWERYLSDFTTDESEDGVVVFGGGSTVSFSEEDFNNLKSIVAEIRASIVDGTL